MTDDAAPSGEQFWEERYASASKVWSGRVNPSFAAVVDRFHGSTALELGCGEGADALWLAARGWTVLGIDISPTAVSRASAEAASASLSDNARFEAADVVTWRTDERFDLVYSSFLHTPAEFPRIEVLRRATEAVSPGGFFVVVAHAAPPPWAGPDHKPHHASMLPAALELEALALGSDWEVALAEDMTRVAESPDGDLVELLDAVVVARRTPAVD